MPADCTHGACVGSLKGQHVLLMDALEELQAIMNGTSTCMPCTM